MKTKNLYISLSLTRSLTRPLSLSLAHSLISDNPSVIVITSDSRLGDEGERAVVYSKNTHRLCIVRGGRNRRIVNAAEEGFQRRVLAEVEHVGGEVTAGEGAIYVSN